MGAGRSIIGDTAINIAAMAFGLVGGLAFQSMLAWHLGPAGCGEYGVWIAIATIAAVIFTLGTDRAVQIYLISSRITTAQATCTVVLIGVIGSITAMAVLWGAFQSNWQLFANVSVQNRVIALFVVPAIALPLALQLLMAGLGHFMAVAAISIVRASLQVVLAVTFFILLGWDARAAYATFVLSSAVTAVAYVLYLSRKHELRIDLVSPKMAAGIVGYSMRYFPARIGNVLNTKLVLLVLAFFASKHDIGLFSLAVVLMGQSLVCSNALNRAIQPRIGDATDGNPGLIAQCCRSSTLLYGALLLGFLLFIGVATPVLFSSSFEGSIPLFWILAPGVWLKGASKPLRAYFIGSDRPGVVSVSMIVELVAASASMAILYPLAGITGAAMGAALGYAGGTMVLVVAFHWSTGYGFVETWLWNKVDTQCLKDHIVAAFKIRLKRRTFRSQSAAAKCSRDQIPRQVILASESVIKKLPEASFQLELDRTMAIAEVGNSTRLFTVPEILDFDEENRVIEFRRLTGIKPIGEILHNENRDAFLFERIGQSLAAIHNELRTSIGGNIPLPETWDLPSNTPVVYLHGDFTAFNVFYREESDELVILDCATSDRCGAQATIGSWCFDTAWFARSLLYGHLLKQSRAVTAAIDAIAFVEAYCRHRFNPPDTSEFTPYLTMLLSKFSERQEQGKTTFQRRSRDGRMAESNCQMFVQAMTSALSNRKNLRLAPLEHLSGTNCDVSEREVDRTFTSASDSILESTRVPERLPLRRAQ